jgi:hypothetical protein
MFANLTICFIILRKQIPLGNKSKETIMNEKKEFVKPERQLEDFTKDFNPYLKDLSKGYYATKDTPLSILLMAKNSWKVLYRLMQKFSPVRPNLFPVVAAIWAIPALGLPTLSISAYPKYGVPAVGGAIII